MPKAVILFGVIALFAAVATQGLANVTRNLDSCVTEGPYEPRRQTVVLIDGSLMEDTGAEGVLPFWRREMARFVDAQSSEAAVLMAPHERLSLGVLKPDGTGVNIFFEGCLPLLAQGEIEELSAKETKLDWFLGNGWKDQNDEKSESFAKSAAISAVLAARGLNFTPLTERRRFADSALTNSLRNFPGVDKNFGIPRLVLITDLASFDLPDGDDEALISAGHLDGDKIGMRLGYSELHVISQQSPNSGAAIHYLRALFLSSEADLKTLATASGALTNIGAPLNVRTFQGTIQMKKEPEERLLVRMRIAWDQNYTVVGSWMEETQVKVRYTPFNGSLTCSSDTNCEFIGDGLFAQIWSGKPGDEAACLRTEERLPFGGFRTLSFKIAGEMVTGLVSDETCYFSGLENGTPFEMKEILNGRM